jgi:hypothetical protein
MAVKKTKKPQLHREARAFRGVLRTVRGRQRLITGGKASFIRTAVTRMDASFFI